MEYHKDVAGEKLYASRNYNHLRHTYDSPGANRAQVDWNLTLRQVRKPLNQVKGSASMPNLTEFDESRKREPLAPAHPDGPYRDGKDGTGRYQRYQNYANSQHMLQGVVRVSAGSAPNIDWQLNLRGGLHGKEFDTKWRRHHARVHQSFDMMKENCSATNEAFQNSQITPQDRRPDRSNSALPIATIRDDPISFKRWAGCEGTQVGQWLHLIEDHSRGYKTRRHIQFETTMREDLKDPNGARICDNRSDGCIVEMLGKKKWLGAQSYDPLVAHWPKGDAKLYYLSQMRPLPEANEENRQRRMTKAPRTDADIPERRTPHERRGRTKED